MTHATDPVCGMSVNPSSAVRATHEGEAFYFCSERCRGEFDRAPARWAGVAREEGRRAAPRADEMEKHEPPFTTSGGITAPKFVAAGSGGAEYERLPEKHD